LTAALEDTIVQGCRSLQLRAATSLGCLWHAQGRSTEAVQLLKSACSTLAEGRDWDDFKAATHLMQIAAAASESDNVCTDPHVVDDSFDEPSSCSIEERG
jgi:thioredoxin-like negative regulator of GroEL